MLALDWRRRQRRIRQRVPTSFHMSTSEMKRFATIPILVAVFLLAGSMPAAGQVTTATLRGEVVDETDDALPGANVIAIHQPSGTQYGTTTNASGRYTLPNVRVGGPYQVTASFVGYQRTRESGIQLGLGESRSVDFVLVETTEELDGVEVVAEGGVFSDENDGVSTRLSTEEVESAPTVGRELADLTRLTPQAFVVNDDDDGSAISIAGQNNRLNAIYIDGAVSNDVFGLSAQGTDGGQTGASPISIDAIEAVEVNISPFTVLQSGFAGGAINTVTRSGTNDFAGSLYYLRRDQNFAEDLPDFSNNRFGFRVGGPIIKDRLFFHVTAEGLRSDNPQPAVAAGQYQGDTPFNGDGDLGTIDGVDEIAPFLREELGYDPGGFGDRSSSLDNENVVARLDYNANPSNRFSLRYIYNDPENTDQFRTDSREVQFANNAEVFPSTTHTVTGEWNATIGNRYANKFLISYKRVRDDRGFAGDPFPFVSIDDGDAEISIGSEQFSTANLLEQDVVTFTNNFDIFLGDHTLTLGTTNEFYRLSNTFIARNFGAYEYRSLSDFIQSVRAVNNPNISPAAPDRFQRGFSLQDDVNLNDGTFSEVVGDGTNAAGDFDAFILGFYVQDQWQLSDRLRLTGGLRLDMPKVTSDPRFDSDVFTETLPNVQNFYNLNGARPGEMPNIQFRWAPRFGFNYDVFGDRRTQIRGGIGVYNSRNLFVWYGGSFLNNGVNSGFISQGDTEGDGINGVATADGAPAPFIPVQGRDGSPNDLLDVTELQGRSASSVIPSGRLEIFEEDFTPPRFLRYALGVDQQLPFGFIGTLEGQYTNTLQSLEVTNVNLRPANAALDGSDNRPIWDYSDNRDIDDGYSDIHRIGNTSRGYAYDVTARLRKVSQDVLGSNSRLALDASYTYGDSWVVNDLTSSQINSIWEGVEHVNGANSLDLSRSDFSIGHRVIASLTMRKEYLSNLASSLTITYVGESGRPFSYVIDESDNMVGEGGDPNSLFYVPRQASELAFGSLNDNGDLVIEDAATQSSEAATLDRFIRTNEYLSTRRGQYAERNADRTPWEGVVDLRFTQEVFGSLVGQNQSLQLRVDIFNFSALMGELFDTDWGNRFQGDAQFQPVEFLGFARDAVSNESGTSYGELTPVYRQEVSDVRTESEIFDVLESGSTYSSQWQMQVGVRYTF